MAARRLSIWPTVRQHQWKWERRSSGQRITGILWHATRGGQWYEGRIEMQAAINWFSSPNNSFNGGQYAGISNYIVGPGTIVEVVPEDCVPRWSSWPSDLHAISIEVAQSNLGQVIEKETIDACVELALELEEKYDIPRQRVFPRSDWDWTGHAGHADTVQGKAQGKTDPDDRFWGPFWAALNSGGDAVADAKDVIEELKRNKSLRDAFLALLMEEGPIHLAMDPKKKEGWRNTLGVTGSGQDVRQVLGEISRRALGTNDFERGLEILFKRLWAQEMDWVQAAQAAAMIATGAAQLQKALEAIRRDVARGSTPEG